MPGAMALSLALNDATMPDSRDRDTAVPLMDEEEFRAFYERTSRPLWAYLARITGNPHQADDVLQEAYYRMYRAAAKYESDAHRRNSLFRIATNVARDAARRAKHRSDEPIADELRSHATTPDTEVQVRTDLSRAMTQLDPVQRELLWLAYAQGASHDEIADVLGLRSISIRTLLFRARKKLAKLLETGQ
jgi:RNA polymerase sigma-70 factor (ECF subfamily)